MPEYRKSTYQIILILFFLILLSSSAQSQVAIKGSAVFCNNGNDLSKVKDISGDWQFFFGKHLSANEMKRIDQKDKKYIKVPSSWSNIAIDGKKLPNFGIATYYLQIVVDSANRNSFQQYGIHIENISTAYKLYVDDKPIMQAGEASTDSNSFRPMFYPQAGYFSSESDTIDIVIQVTNYFESSYSGVSSKILFGKRAQVRQLNFYKTAFSVFLMSILLIMFFFQLVIGTIQKKSPSHLVLALLSILFCLKMTLDGDVTIFHLFPNFNYYTGYRLWLLSFLSLPLVFKLISESFPQDSIRIINKSVYIFYTILGILFLTLNINFLVNNIFIVIYISIFLVIYIFCVLARAVYKKRNYSVIHIVSFSIMMLLFLNDLIYVTNQSTSGYLSELGVCLYIIVQSTLVSVIFAKSAQKVTELNYELETVNQNLEAKVKTRTVELQESNMKLGIIVRQKDFLISTISHDLKNSFNNIINLSNLLTKETDLEESQKNDLAERILDTSRKGSETLENLLGWARLQISTKLEQRDITYLSLYVNDSIQHFSDQIMEKDIKTSVKIDDSLFFSCDESHLNAILRNIISNSIKFCSPGGLISVENELKDGYVLIKIHDNGIGIPENIVSTIFDYSSSKKRRGTSGEQGSGLGLVIVKELVENNNGFIKCISEPESYTEFIISFPVLTGK